MKNILRTLEKRTKLETWMARRTGELTLNELKAKDVLTTISSTKDHAISASVTDNPDTGKRTVVVRESVPSKYTVTRIDVQSTDYAESDLPDVCAVRTTTRTNVSNDDYGHHEVERIIASFPPSAEDTPGASLTAMSLVGTMQRVIDAQSGSTRVSLRDRARDLFKDSGQGYILPTDRSSI